MLLLLFTAGIVVTTVLPGNNALVSANTIGDYSYVSARVSTNGEQIARCATGLGPGNTDDNNNIGSFSFNGSSVPFAICGASTHIVLARGAGSLNNNVGVVNIAQCRAFSTTAEGIYTCAMTNSSMVEQSVRFGVYFPGRSE